MPYLLCVHIVWLSPHVHVCVYHSVRDCVTNPQLLPSASFRRHNFSKLIIAVNHCCLPTLFFFFFYPEAPLCPCPLPPTLLRPRLATARRNELSCRWEPGGSRREGIQELLIDSLLAFMEIVVKLQFVALMIFRWSRLESTHFTNCFDFFLFPRADLHEVAHKSSLFLFNYCLIWLVNSCSWFSKPSESNLGCICKTTFGKKKRLKKFHMIIDLKTWIGQFTQLKPNTSIGYLPASPLVLLCLLLVWLS